MFIYDIWDVFIFEFIKIFDEFVAEVLPIFGIILLCVASLGALAFGLHYLDCKYWHTKDWSARKQVAVGLVACVIMLFIGFIVVGIVCVLTT